MERGEFNRMLQTVQEIETQVGYQILRIVTHRCDDGRVTEGAWYAANGDKVMWQENPFTDLTTYHVNPVAYDRIVYADFCR